MNVDHILFDELLKSELTDNILINFDRYQETHEVWVEKDNDLILHANSFIDDWEDTKKLTVIQELRTLCENGGFVIGVFDAQILVGFAGVDGISCGSQNQYHEMVYLHVSRSYRKLGIGSKLFQKVVNKAKTVGMNKLYIASHPSIESQGFYSKIGCVRALEIIPRIKEKEPLDIQLEYVLRN